MDYLRLETLNVIVANSYLEDNDIHVDFEYEKLSEKELRLYLKAFIGKDKGYYRFLMNVIFFIEFQYYYSDDEIIEKAIHMVMEPLMNMIVLIDSLIKEPKERLS